MSDSADDFGPFAGGLKVQRPDKPQKPNPPPGKFHTMRSAPNPRAPEIKASSGPAAQYPTARNAVPLQGVLIGSLDESKEGESIKAGSSVSQNIMDIGLDNEKDFFSWKPLFPSTHEKPPAESENKELVALNLPAMVAKDSADLKGKTVVPNDPFAAFFQDITHTRNLGTGNNASSAQSSALMIRRPASGTQSNVPSVSQPSIAVTRPIQWGTKENVTSVPSGIGVTRPGNTRVRRNMSSFQHVPSILDNPIDDLNCPLLAPITPVTSSAGTTNQGTLATDTAPSVPSGVDVTSPGTLGDKSNAPPVQRVSILDNAKDDLDLIFGPLPPVTTSSAVTSSGTSGRTSNANPFQPIAILDDTKDDLELMFGPMPRVPASSAVTGSGTLGKTSSARPVQRTTNITDRTSPLDRVLFGSTAAAISSDDQEKQKRAPWVLRGSDVTGDDSLEDKPDQPSVGVILDLDTPPGDTKTPSKIPSATHYSDSFLELQEAFKNMDLSREHTHRRSSAPSNHDSEWVISGPGPIPHSASPARPTRASNDLDAGNFTKDNPSSSVNTGFSDLLAFLPPKSLPSANRTGDSELSDKDEISGFVPRSARQATRTGDLDEQSSERNGPPSRDSSMGSIQTPTSSDGDNQGVAVPQNDNEE